MARPVLADADVLIDFQAGVGAAGAVRKLIAAGRLRVPVVAFYELWRGALDDEERERLRRLLRGAPVLVLTRQDVEIAAGLWRKLPPRVRDEVGDRDLLIAGAALARGWPLLTRNRTHFAATGVELHPER